MMRRALQAKSSNTCCHGSCYEYRCGNCSRLIINTTNNNIDVRHNVTTRAAAQLKTLLPSSYNSLQSLSGNSSCNKITSLSSKPVALLTQCQMFHYFSCAMLLNKSSSSFPTTVTPTTPTISEQEQEEQEELELKEHSSTRAQREHHQENEQSNINASSSTKNSTSSAPRRVIKSKLRKSLRSSDDTLNALLDEDKMLISMKSNHNKHSKSNAVSHNFTWQSENKNNSNNNDVNDISSSISSSDSTTLTPREAIRKMQRENELKYKYEQQDVEQEQYKSERTEQCNANNASESAENQNMKERCQELEEYEKHYQNNEMERNDQDSSNNNINKMKMSRLKQTMQEFTVEPMAESEFDSPFVHDERLEDNERQYYEEEQQEVKHQLYQRYKEQESQEEEEYEEELKEEKEVEEQYLHYAKANKKNNTEFNVAKTANVKVMWNVNNINKTDVNDYDQGNEKNEENDDNVASRSKNRNAEERGTKEEQEQELSEEQEHMYSEGSNEKEEESRMSRKERKLSEQRSQRQAYLLSCTTDYFVNVIKHYLEATINPRLVSHEEEHMLFPVLQTRLKELHIDQMLDIVESPWARSTLLRYGEEIKDAIRDRIAQLALRAAYTSNDEEVHNSNNNNNSNNNCNKSYNSNTNKNIDDGDENTKCEGQWSRTENEQKGNEMKDAQEEEEEEQQDEVDYLYEDEKAAIEELRASDPILLAACKEINAVSILRCTVVIGMSAGRRKRDLEFFQVMGSYIAYYINTYKDPHDLVKVLTVFARAKIMPSQNFLALLARRLPILHKTCPMEQLPCYRALVNFARMHYEPMAIYRFLADTMISSMESKLREEAKQQILNKLRMQSLTAAKLISNDITSNHDKKGNSSSVELRETNKTYLQQQKAAADKKEEEENNESETVNTHVSEEEEEEEQEEEEGYEKNNNAATRRNNEQEEETINKTKAAVTVKATTLRRKERQKDFTQDVTYHSLLLQSELPPLIQARQRLYYLTGLMPTMFTRFLFTLGKFGAPHQQYFRPFITPLIVPLLPFLSPPSFSRLITAACYFKTSDVELLEPLTEFVMRDLYECNRGRLNVLDVFGLLKLLQYVELKIPNNFDRFM